MSNEVLAAKAVAIAESMGDDAMKWVKDKVKMLRECSRNPKTSTYEVKFRRDLEEFVKRQEKLGRVA